MTTKKVQIVVLVDGLGRYAFQGVDGDSIDDQLNAARQWLDGEYADDPQGFKPHPLRAAHIVEVEIEIPEPKAMSLVPSRPTQATWVDPRPYVLCDPFNRQPEPAPAHPALGHHAPLHGPVQEEYLDTDADTDADAEECCTPEPEGRFEIVAVEVADSTAGKDNLDIEVIEEERSVTATHRQTRRSLEFDPAYSPPQPAHGNKTSAYREAIARLLHERGPLRQSEICRAANIPTGSFGYAIKHWRFEKAEDGDWRLAVGAEPKIIPAAKPIERAPEMQPAAVKKTGPLSTSDYKAAVIEVLTKYARLFEYDIGRLAKVPTGALKYVLDDEQLFQEVATGQWRLKKEL